MRDLVHVIPSIVILVSPIDVILECSRELGLLGRATPLNASAERHRLARALEHGKAASPQWVYSAHDLTPLRERLQDARDDLDGPFADLVRARVDELLLECDLAENVGHPSLGEIARERFGGRGDVEEEDVHALALELAARPPRERDEARIRSNSTDERSLLSLMRASVRVLALPFEVTVCSSLSALAATGHRTILISEGRDVTERVARRTVLHEVRGHALPRARARSLHPIFSLGTAGGHDDQEGFALLLEERAGMLDDERRFELGARHLATSAMRDGATFVEVARHLHALGMSAHAAILYAERAFRGSDGNRPGLGREAVYLEAFVRVKQHVAKIPTDEVVLEHGQISVGAIESLRALVIG